MKVSKSLELGARCPLKKIGKHYPTHNRAKLSPEQVNEIRRRRYKERLTLSSLATVYGVTAQTIGKICKGESWNVKS